MKKAFTLIELLVVVFLISIVYGIYFYTVAKNSRVEEFSLFKVKEYLNLQAITHGDKLTLICNNDNEICYLLNEEKKIVEEIEFKEKVKVFLLKDDEILEPARYKSLELSDDIYMLPDLIFKKLNKRQFETLIYYTSDSKWVYVSPYFDDTQEFINKEDIISYIKKRYYLPMYSGLADD
ncbi:type II secretion system protein [Sulfurimonas sp.]